MEWTMTIWWTNIYSAPRSLYPAGNTYTFTLGVVGMGPTALHDITPAAVCPPCLRVSSRMIRKNAPEVMPSKATEGGGGLMVCLLTD